MPKPHRFSSVSPKHEKQWYTLGDVQERLQGEIDSLGTKEAVAKKYEINSAFIHNALEGFDSPTLRTVLNMPKSPPRTRLCIDTDRETIRLFDDTCEYLEMTRNELLKHLLWMIGETL